MTVWDWLLFIVSCFLILIIILQESKEDAASAFSGEKSALFSDRKKIGIEVWISRITTILSILLFVLSMVCAFMKRG
ncbi:MAG: preprotein translocase subunit SecG [Bacilli bacterium]|nr:preprotein translocase subunit SecG [Acholeplasmataceae bacterium]MDY2903111.1 preprotein translocase subunit SecG [Bacilli bacterium]